MKKSSSKKKLGIVAAVLILLSAVAAILKLFGMISWPWWIVSAPLWASAIAAVVIIGLFAIIVITFIIFSDKK